MARVCDGYNDCLHGEDEIGCGNMFYCLDGQQTVHKSQVNILNIEFNLCVTLL